MAEHLPPFQTIIMLLLLLKFVWWPRHDNDQKCQHSQQESKLLLNSFLSLTNRRFMKLSRKTTILDKLNGNLRPPFPHKSRIEKWLSWSLLVCILTLGRKGCFLFHFIVLLGIVGFGDNITQQCYYNNIYNVLP